MIKVILLVTCLLGQTLATPVFEIDGLMTRMNSDGQNNVYELSENQTQSSTSIDPEMEPNGTEYYTTNGYRKQMLEFAAQFYNQVRKQSGANVNILYSPIR